MCLHISDEWPTIGHSCSTINGQPLLVNHLILNRYPLVGKGFLCTIFYDIKDRQCHYLHRFAQPFVAVEAAGLG